MCVCIDLWGSSRVSLAQNRTSGLIIHAANTLIWPGEEYSRLQWQSSVPWGEVESGAASALLFKGFFGSYVVV